MTRMPDLIYALTEEIGDPDLFVGRKAELARLMDWAAGVKRRLSKSTGILSRRKMGKTALLQRFFNILYTRNDPQLIPFYVRIHEEPIRRFDFAVSFYRRLLTQYFAFTTRTPEMVKKPLPFAELKELARDDRHVADDIRVMEDIVENFPAEAWQYAREAGDRISALNDVRIIQILDEFQYLDKWIRDDYDSGRVVKLCASYLGPAASKVSPQLVAGSYVGWLNAILRHMVGRYREWRLGSLADEEALEAVYNYAHCYQVPITDDTAPYIAEVTGNDPFYIAATISNLSEEKDLTTRAGVLDALAFETIPGKGEIAQTWMEYVWPAFDQVNDKNAHKIVLYLAAHEPEERGRDQILEDLGLEMTDRELEERLHKLVKADILADGSSNFRYRGLGDRIFAMVFRRIYSEEIERISVGKIESDFKREVDSARRQAAWHKGDAAEYKARYRLLVASLAGAALADVVANPQEGLTLDRFRAIGKARFYLDQEKSVEAAGVPVDLHAVSEREDGTDLIVEVKAWKRAVTRSEAAAFVKTREALAGRLEKKTGFLFYSESGLSRDAAAVLEEAGVMIVDVAKLAGYEMPRP